MKKKIIFCLGVFAAAVALAESPRISIEGEAKVFVDDGVVRVVSSSAVSFVRLDWTFPFPEGTLTLNDTWERSYGNLEWKRLEGRRTSPWYFLAKTGDRTLGFGVETGPGALCCWVIRKDGYSLVLDLRAGGQPVRLGGRTLTACRIVRAQSEPGESPWDFGRRFCRQMCPSPKLPKSPVFGYNDWYCAYGRNTATNFLEDAAYVVACARECREKPYVVMDDGWQRNSPPVVKESGRGPWTESGPHFGMNMQTFCRKIAELGAKPGLWYRPLRAWDELPDDQKLRQNPKYLDPTVPAVKSRIAEDMRRFRDWGFRLVKIDFLCHDIAEAYASAVDGKDHFIQDSRLWRDSSRTTAEVMLDLYRTMKDSVGEDVVIIGCNAFNHLAAGVFEVQRTGNDTSGRDWSWTCKNGVNTLGMRSIQDGAFFKVDADCVGLAAKDAIDWSLNSQWMELLGRSGTPFFVSWHRDLATEEVRRALTKAFRAASESRQVVEPMDWLDGSQPKHWRFADGNQTFSWDDLPNRYVMDDIEFGVEPVKMFERSAEWVQAREPQLARLPDGSLYCALYAGGKREPSPENVVIAVRSYDDGATWTKPEVVFSHKARACWATELSTFEGEPKLMFATFVADRLYAELRPFRVGLGRDAKGSLRPEPFHGVPPNFSVRQGSCLSDGSWIYPVYWAENTGEWDASITYPNGIVDLKDWERGGWRYSCGVIRSTDKGRTWQAHGAVGNPKEGWFWEPCAVELEPGHVRMFIRAGSVLWASDSFDFGVTWSDPKPTDIPNANTKPMVLRHGKDIVLVNNVTGDGWNDRRRLEIWVSHDFCRSWKKFLAADATNAKRRPCFVCYPSGFCDDVRKLFYLVVDACADQYLLKFPYGMLGIGDGDDVMEISRKGCKTAVSEVGGVSGCGGK